MTGDAFSFLLSSPVHTQVGIRLLVASLELIGLVCLLSVFFRLFKLPSYRFRSLLWVAVLVKPVMTLLAGSPIVLARIEIDPLEQSQVQSVRKVPEFWEAGGLRDDLMVLNGNEVSNPPVPGGERAWRSLSVSDRRVLTGLALLWILGIAAGGVYWALAGRRLGRILRRGIPPTARLDSLYRELLTEKKIEKPPLLLVSSELESPVIFGAIRPVILFPTWLLKRDDGTIRHLLAHELGHHLHRDPLALAFAKLSLVLFFFNPVIHWAYREWTRSVEIACDRTVFRNPDEARDYASELVSVLEGMQSRQAALSGLYATRHQIGARIDALLENPMRSPRTLSQMGAFGVFLFVVALAFFGFGVETVKPVAGGDDEIFVGRARTPAVAVSPPRADHSTSTNSAK